MASHAAILVSDVSNHLWPISRIGQPQQFQRVRVFEKRMLMQPIYRHLIKSFLQKGIGLLNAFGASLRSKTRYPNYRKPTVAVGMGDTVLVNTEDVNLFAEKIRFKVLKQLSKA